MLGEVNEIISIKIYSIARLLISNNNIFYLSICHSSFKEKVGEKLASDMDVAFKGLGAM
jgi:hypothetical protein